MKFPKKTTRVTVVCDCTRYFDIHSSIWATPEDYFKGKVVITNYSPNFSREDMYNLLEEVSKSKDSYLIILGNPAEVMALSVVLSNSTVKDPVEEIPRLDPAEVRVWEVFDDHNVLISNEEGRVITSSYDEALRPLVSDAMMIQAKNVESVETLKEENPDDPSTIQIVETPETASSLKEIIEKRKDQSKTSDESK